MVNEKLHFVTRLLVQHGANRLVDRTDLDAVGRKDPVTHLNSRLFGRTVSMHARDDDSFGLPVQYHADRGPAMFQDDDRLLICPLLRRADKPLHMTHRHGVRPAAVARLLVRGDYYAKQLRFTR